MDLYSEIILDHYKNPHHHGKLAKPSVTIIEHNTLCGDKIELDLKFENGKVTEVGTVTEGCAISQAAMSLLSDELIGKTAEEIAAIKNEKMYSLLNVPISPGRVKCALLGLAAAQKAVKKLSA